MAKKMWMLFLLILVTSGCAVSPSTYWEQSLWEIKEHQNTVLIGEMQTGELEFNVILTEFVQVMSAPYESVKVIPSFIAVSVTCKNKSGYDLKIGENPVQVINQNNMLSKELDIDYVMYKLYGGKLKEASQWGRLTELSEPIPTNDTFSGAILAGIVEGIRSAERSSIIHEMYQKESSQYQIFYNQFESVVLPSNVAVSWTQYHPFDSGPMKITLQGSEGDLSFRRGIVNYTQRTEVQTAQMNKTTQQSLAVVGAIALIILVFLMMDEAH